MSIEPVNMQDATRRWLIARNELLEAEIKRLEASVPTEIAKGTYALAVEIERLQAALQEIEALEDRAISEAVAIARAALEPKP